MADYQGFGNWLEGNNYKSWKVYISYMKTISGILKEDYFEKILSATRLKQLFSQLEADVSFKARGDSDKSNLLSGFRTYINYITESQTPMQVWRIGSNWGDKNVLSVFKEHRVAYAGKEVENQVQNVREGDLVAVTNGQSIVAVGKVSGLIDLKSFDATYVDQYEDVKAITISPYYFKEEFSQVDFGIYEGQGKQFHKAHGNYADNITKLFNRLSTDNMDKNNEYEKLISVLKYKKQIILQGPPGTGKTFTAKKIAESMTQPKPQGNAIEKINDFLRNFVSSNPGIIESRIKIQELLKTFQELFPKEQLQDLTLEDYAIGTGSNSSFCWWLERGLKPIGYYSPGSARSYLIYWSEKLKSYSKHGKVISEIEEDSEAMKKIAQILSEFVQKRDFEKASQYFGQSFLLKLLQSYYPDEYAAVNSVPCLQNILKIFGTSSKGLNALEMNKKVQELFLQKRNEFGKDVTNIEFMKFLFDNFNLKGEVEIVESELLIKGKFKIIQFHPAYTYEDFVRGISVKTNNNNDIEYLVENKILADFAQEALDNPASDYLLIIDEINRANLPAVLGELIYALEYRYDEENPELTSVEIMYELKETKEDAEDGKTLRLPKNLYIIGTMNTADRSVGHIDYAIRRRFAFVDIPPSEDVILKEVPDPVKSKAIKLFNEVANLFSKGIIAPDFKADDVQLGHSYFLVKSEDELKLKLNYEIKPLLKEYLKDGILQTNYNSTLTTENYIDQLSF